MIAYAKKALSKDLLDPYQHYVILRFLECCENKNFENQPPYLYFNGTAEEKALSRKNFTVFNLNLRDLSNKQSIIEELFEKILSIDGDVLCIQEMLTGETSYALYEKLKNNYAHFYIEADSHLFEFSPETPPYRGTFIASKYSIESPYFTHFSIQQRFSRNGFFDFVIKDKETCLSHLYLAKLELGPFEEILTMQLEQIIEKMQADFLELSEKERIPFFLCGNLGTLQGFKEITEELINAYFYRTDITESTSYNLLLQSLPSIPNQVFYQEYLIEDILIPMLDSHSGLLTNVKKINQYDISPAFKSIEELYSNENVIILCEGHAEISGSTKTDGSSSMQGGVSVSTDSDNGGKFSAGVNGGITQDSEGNTSGYIEGRITYDW
ncbi:MAG: hypothetical protein ACM3JI_00580 [Anaerolineae bacterium]